MHQHPTAHPYRWLLAASMTATVLLPLTVDPPSATAGPVASGEVRVNTTTADYQDSSDIAMDAVGDYVVTWRSGGAFGSGLIYAQRYNAAGIPQGGETLVSTIPLTSQTDPSVAMDADGDYVITWSGYRAADATHSASYGIYARRFDAAGNTQGNQLLVSSSTNLPSNEKVDPSVAMSAAGAFVVAWAANGLDGSLYGISSARYNAAGVRQGTQDTLVNTTTTGIQWEPEVAMDADGDYVVVWTSFDQDGGGGGGAGVYAQRFSSAGIPRGPETRVNTYVLGSQDTPKVAMDATGDYVVAWTSEDDQDGSAYGVYSQRYSAGGVPRGGETLVNTETEDVQFSGSAAMDADGDYVITWSSYGQDGDANGAYAQRYTARGTPVGPETRLNTTTAADQRASGSSLDADGDLVATWSSDLQDGSALGVYARRFRGPDPVDLALTQSESADPVAVGTGITYRIRVANLEEAATVAGVPAIDDAIGAANGVYVVSTPPDGATFVSGTGAGWTCTALAATVRCRLSDPLRAGGVSSGLSLTYTAGSTAGPALHVARVFEDQLDPNPSNSSETERTSVRCALGFTDAGYAATESGTMTVSVTRSGSGCGTSSIQYESLSGSATEGEDFADTSGTLAWGPTDTTATFDVPIVDDSLDESDEQLRLRLGSPVGGVLDNRTLIAGTIADNDAPPRVNFVTTSGSGAEPGQLVDVSVRLSTVSGQPVTVSLTRAGTATSGADYFAPTKITVPAGQREASFSIEVVDDNIVEGTETATLTLAAPVNAVLGALRTYQLTVLSNE